jgi:hypothetical protein
MCTRARKCKKKIPVETVPGMGGGRIKENDGGGKFKCDIFDKHDICKNLYKCHNVTAHSTTIRGKIFKKITGVWSPLCNTC